MSVAHSAGEQPELDPAIFQGSFFATPRPLLLVAADPPRFTMLAVNRAHAQVFRTTQEALTGSGVFEVFGPAPSPEAAAFMASIRESFEAVLASGRPHQMPVVGLQDRYWTAINAPVLGADRQVTQIVSAVSDVTGEVLERRSEEARKLLMREVDHRARNALTVVQSLVRFTSGETIEAYRKRLSDRVEALSRAQTSLAARRWEGAALAEVIDGELRAIAEPERYRLDGPPIDLPAQHVQAMSMAAHELAVNARKYGSLSTDSGRVTVSWRIEAGGLELTWREEGASRVVAPARQGFGTRLIGRLARQLGGKVAYEWRPGGLVATFQLRASSRRAPS